MVSRQPASAIGLRSGCNSRGRSPSLYLFGVLVSDLGLKTVPAFPGVSNQFSLGLNELALAASLLPWLPSVPQTSMPSVAWIFKDSPPGSDLHCQIAVNAKPRYRVEFMKKRDICNNEPVGKSGTRGRN